jgi:hypothetical protein
MKFEIHFEFRASLRKFQDLNFWDATYSNADYAGRKIDRKSTSGTCQFLGRSLVSWASKK